MLFKKKVHSISLAYFHKRVGELAAKFGQDCYAVRADMTVYGKDREPFVVLEGYIYSFKWVTGNTIEEVLEKLEAQMVSAPKSDLADITI